MVELNQVEEAPQFTPEEVEQAIEAETEAIEQAILQAEEAAEEAEAEAEVEAEVEEAVEAIEKQLEAELTAADEEEEDEDDEDEDDEDEYEDDFDENETVLERIEALKDILKPETREFFANSYSNTKSLILSSTSKIGSSLWYLTTTGLLLGVPLAISILGETQLMELEKELHLQQSSQEVMAPGTTSVEAAK